MNAAAVSPPPPADSDDELRNTFKQFMREKASHLDTCDCCHDLFPIRELELTGSQFLCPKCRRGVTD